MQRFHDEFSMQDVIFIYYLFIYIIFKEEYML